MDPFRYRIVVEWSEEDARFLARVPALGCVAHGKTEGIAAHEARKAAEAMLTVLKEDGDEAPPVDTAADYSGQTRLRLPRTLHAQLARDASAEGVSLNSLLLTRLASRGKVSGKVSTKAEHVSRTKGEHVSRESHGEDSASHDRASHDRPVSAARPRRTSGGS
jgi:antitoxin HicB